MKRPIWSDLDLVRCPIHYGLCTDEKQYEAELERLRVPHADRSPFISNSHSHATAHHLDNKGTGKTCVIVCMRPGAARTGIEIAGLLVHEAVHIWQEIRRNIGEHEPSSEFEAYSLQTIAQELMWLYREQIVKHRR